jgi:hypothetical protein
VSSRRCGSVREGRWGSGGRRSDGAEVCEEQMGYGRRVDGTVA